MKIEWLRKVLSFKWLQTNPWAIIFIVVFFWIGITFIAFTVAGFDPIRSGPIGDTFGAVNALFTGLALAFVGYQIYQSRTELKQNQKLLEQTSEMLKMEREQLQRQQQELETQNRSWKLITYLNAMEVLSGIGDIADRHIARKRILMIDRNLQQDVANLIEKDGMPTVSVNQRKASGAIEEIEKAIISLGELERNKGYDAYANKEIKMVVEECCLALDVICGNDVEFAETIDYLNSLGRKEFSAPGFSEPSQLVSLQQLLRKNARDLTKRYFED